MLALDSPEWRVLKHCYGTAEDIPPLLTELAQYPSHAQYDDEPWHTLWSSLCHQSDIYPASFAAVPHILRLAAASPDQICSNYLLLPACIEASRLSGSAPAIPEHLAASYHSAIATLPGIVASCFDRAWDDDWVRTATAALCVAKGHGGLATAILDLTPDILERFSTWAHEEWQRQHPPIPAPPLPPPSFSGDGPSFTQ
jgi:hypothetical protein